MNKRRIIILVAAAIILASVFVYAKIARNKKRIRLADLKQAIREGIGANGTDIDSLLVQVKPDPTYTFSGVDLTLMKVSKGVVYDKPENFAKVLTGKSKARIKALSEQMKANSDFQMSLQKWIDSVGVSAGQMEQIFSIIKQAK